MGSTTEEANIKTSKADLTIIRRESPSYSYLTCFQTGNYGDFVASLRVSDGEDGEGAESGVWAVL